MNLKTWSARAGNQAAVLARADNSGHRLADQYEPLTLPVDEDGYVVSFSPGEGDAAAMAEFFDRYGMVVVADVLPPQDCMASVAELWEFLERQVSGLDRNQPETWERWAPLAGLGLLGNTFNLSPQLCRNRQSVSCCWQRIGRCRGGEWTCCVTHTHTACVRSRPSTLSSPGCSERSGCTSTSAGAALPTVAAVGQQSASESSEGTHPRDWG